MKKNQRNQILVAVHDEAGGLLGGLGVDHATKFNSLVAFMVSLLGMDLLIGNDADCKAADASVTADHGLAVLRLVLVEGAAVEHTRKNFLHVIRPRGR